YLFEKSEKPALDPAAAGSAERGQKLFETVGCQGCHISDPKAERDVMAAFRQHGPNLIGLADKTTPAWVAHWLKNPKSWNPATRMPNLRLSDAEIADLTAFLMTKTTTKEFQAINVPKPHEAERDWLIKDYLVLSRSVADAEAELAKMSPHQKDLFV